jgi:hypothetical protein
MKPSPCSKAQSGKCLGGACPNHVGSCHGRSNVRSRSVAPQYNMEDALIDAFDAGLTTDDILEALPRAAA